MNNSNAYIDFYINKISSEDRNKLFDLLSDEDKDIFTSYLNFDEHTGVFFRLVNKELIHS